jgi:hypothetical protein
MAKEIVSVDISNFPALVELVEEVASSGKPRLLRRDSEDVAVLMPLLPASTPRRKSRAKTRADYEAFLTSAGSWANVDTDTLVEDIYESRRASTRSPVEL